MADRLRRTIAIVLLVLGGTVFALGSTGWWLERNFLDTDRFTGITDEILDRQAVQDATARALVTQITRGNEALTVAAPFLTPIIQEIVFSEPFRKVFDRAVAVAHRVLVEQEAPEIVLDLSGIYDDIRAALQEIVPDLAADLPPSDELSIELLDRTQLPFFWDMIDSVRSMITWITLSGVMLLAAGLAVGPRRWRAAAFASWVVVTGLVTLLLAVIVAKMLLLDNIGNGLSRSAAEDAWEVVMRGLVVQTVVLAVLFSLLALLARWTDRRGGVRAFAELFADLRIRAAALWAALRRVRRPAPELATADGVVLESAPAGVAAWARATAERASHVWGRTLRAAVIAVLGLWLVFQPDSIAAFVLLLVGVGAIAFAAIDLAAIVREPPVPRVPPEPEAA